MAYRFKLNEQVGKSLLRSGAEQFQHALASLRSADTTAGIHGTRKCIKRLRALLRLVRPGLDQAAYKHLDTTLRDAGRALSTTRDRDVLLTTIAGLMAASPELRPALRAISPVIVAPDDGASAKPRAGVIRQARDLLQTAATDWRSLELSDDTFATLAEGLARGLRDLGRAYEATDGGDEETFHDLRKAVQRHWRHLRLVEAGWPAYFSARAEEAKAISELLGKAQDLTMLLRHLRDAGATVSGEALAEVDDAVKRRRATLHAAARSRTTRLLAERPRAHARRAAEYWKAAHALQKADLLPPAAARPKTAAPRKIAAEPTGPTAAAAPSKRSPHTTQAAGSRSAKTSKPTRKPA